MIDGILKTLHILVIIVWVGGMAFSHLFLHPAVAQLASSARVRLMHDALGRCFSVVLGAALLILASGLWTVDDRSRGQAGGAVGW